MRPVAVVMNMYHTGLGIARSLGEHGVRVIGLTSRRGFYGNFTRYAKTVFCPDSRNEPEALLAFLLKMRQEVAGRLVIFPTRDDDLLFLDRYRKELQEGFVLAVPETAVLKVCLNKWETHLLAQRAGVSVPKCWLVENAEDLARTIAEVAYPCVLKPISTPDWRRGNNWNIVGSRKAIAVSSPGELLAEYTAIAHASPRMVVQEVIPGGDDTLAITACYLNRDSQFVAAFNTQKLLQFPEGFGTGCILQTAHYPELLAPTLRLLQSLRFTGIAEVEYKWDRAAGEYKLIEINPRPWDQHRLGQASGADLAYIAYCEHAGERQPPVGGSAVNTKWVADDTFLMTAAELLRRRDPKLRTLFRLARGKRIYAIWSMRDPLPFAVYLMLTFIPTVVGGGLRLIRSLFARKSAGAVLSGERV
jgi:predicted ATP-grasp superfamily ATP-dependent carboligase